MMDGGNTMTHWSFTDKNISAFYYCDLSSSLSPRLFFFFLPQAQETKQKPQLLYATRVMIKGAEFLPPSLAQGLKNGKSSSVKLHPVKEKMQALASTS